MSRGPWIRFFPSDWLAGTRGMTAAETGIYITLIAMMYERGEPIQRDHARLARLCGTTPAAMKDTMTVLIGEGKLVVRDGGLWNDRVEIETKIRSEKITQAGKSAKARWKKGKQNQCEADADALRSHCDGNANQNQNQNQNQKEKVDIGIAETGNPPSRELAQPDDRDKRPEPLASSPAELPTTDGQGTSAQQSLIPLDQAQPPPKRPRRVKTALPPDWRLPDDGWSYAAGKGLTGDRIEQEAEKFRDYHLSRGNVMADWAAAWRTWVGNAGKFSAPVAGGYRQRDPPSRADSAIQGIQNFLIRNGELS